MAEGDGLENRYTRKGIKGSNPLLSAKYRLPAGLIIKIPSILTLGVEQYWQARSKNRWRYLLPRYIVFLAWSNPITPRRV